MAEGMLSPPRDWLETVKWRRMTQSQSQGQFPGFCQALIHPWTTHTCTHTTHTHTHCTYTHSYITYTITHISFSFLFVCVFSLFYISAEPKATSTPSTTNPRCKWRKTSPRGSWGVTLMGSLGAQYQWRSQLPLPWMQQYIKGKERKKGGWLFS